MKVINGWIAAGATILIWVAATSFSLTFSPPALAQSCPIPSKPYNPDLEQCLDDATDAWGGDQHECGVLYGEEFLDSDGYRKCLEDARWRYLAMREACKDAWGG
jgi:hypothetical protein